MVEELDRPLPDQPRIALLAERMGLRRDALDRYLDRFSRAGRLVFISPAYPVLPKTIDDLKMAARTCAADHPDELVTVGAFRAQTGVTRHMVFPALEYLDAIGFCRRTRAGRRVSQPADPLRAGDDPSPSP